MSCSLWLAQAWAQQLSVGDGPVAACSPPSLHPNCLGLPVPGSPTLASHVYIMYKAHIGRYFSPLISAFSQLGFDIASSTCDTLFALALRSGHLWILRALKRCSVTLGVGHTGTITHFLPIL